MIEIIKTFKKNSQKNKSGQSYWSVPNIAHYCGICNTACRKTLSSLKEKGYIEISERYSDNV